MGDLRKYSLCLAALLFAAPASACDFHGANGLFWTPANQWKVYSPKVSLMDPVYLDDEERDAANAAGFGVESERAVAQKARPTFSSAANRASQAAKRHYVQAKGHQVPGLEIVAVQSVSIQGKRAGSDEEASSDSEADAQPIR